MVSPPKYLDIPKGKIAMPKTVYDTTERKPLDSGRAPTIQEAGAIVREVLGIAQELYPEGTEFLPVIDARQDDGGMHPWRVYVVDK